MSDQIEWRCDACRLVVKPKEGALWVDDVEASNKMHEERRQQRADAELIEKQGYVGRRISDMIGMESDSRWQVHHYACDLDPDRGYWFDIERVSTHHDLLDVLSHVPEKPWVSEGTNVPGLIRRALSNDALLRNPKRQFQDQEADQYLDSLGDGARRDFLDE